MLSTYAYGSGSWNAYIYILREGREVKFWTNSVYALNR